MNSSFWRDLHTVFVNADAAVFVAIVLFIVGMILILALDKWPGDKPKTIRIDEEFAKQDREARRIHSIIRGES
jgi:hypothetical protein